MAMGSLKVTNDWLIQANDMNQPCLHEPTFVKGPVKMFRFKKEVMSDFWI